MAGQILNAALTGPFLFWTATPSASPASSRAPFPPFFHRETEGNSSADFQSITTHPYYQRFSFEELRLIDYARHGSPNPRSTSFAVAAEPLAAISVPPQLLHTVRSQRSLAIQAPVYGTETVTFRVGSIPTDFVIHKDLVTSKSPFVHGALKGDWKEAQARVIPLEDDCPDTFHLYQQWIYTNKVSSAFPSGDAKAGQEYKQLVKAYLLGEKLMDSRFKDCIIDCILHRMCEDSTFDVNLSSLVYDNTPPKSPLRKLWTHVYAWLGNHSWLDEDLLGEPVHPDFTHDLSRLYLGFWNGQRPPRAPLVDGPCQYHEHAEGICVSHE